MVKHERSRWRRAVRIAGIAVAVLVLIGLGVRLLQPPVLKARATDDITAGLPAASAQADIELELWQSLLREEFGDPAHESRQVECDLTSQDSGWFAISYRQSCHLAVALYYATDDDSASIDRRLGPEGLDEPLGFSVLGPGEQHTCGTIRQSYPLIVAHEPAGEDCHVVQPRYASSTGLIRISKFDPITIDRTTGWLVLSNRFEVSSTDLGCAFPKVVFCSNPLSQPALPNVETP